MDPVTQTLALLRPRALLWKQLDASGDWIVRFPPGNAIVFSFVERGRCLLRAGAAERHELVAGDFVLMSRPSAWSLADSETAATEALSIQSGDGVRVARIGEGDNEPDARIIGGGFTFSDANGSLLEELFATFLVIRGDDPAASRLRGVLELLAGEVLADRPGRSAAVDRLLELMLLEVIRHGRVELPERRGGLLAGLADPQIAAALHAMHRDVKRSWTVSELARICGMSRSMFAERFSRVVGLPPIDYLLRWRMALAKEAIASGRERLAIVARNCGYLSVSAFSAAFIRTVGCPPSRFSRTVDAAQPDEAE